MEYKTIYEDPPWKESGGEKIKRGADAYYPLMREMIEKVSYGPRIELFARDYHNGWDVWGNEVNGIDWNKREE